MHITVVFTEEDGKTTVTSISQLASAEQIDTLMEMGMAEGVIQTWNGLEDSLLMLQNGET